MQESVTSCGTQQFQLPSLLQAAATGSQQQQCSAGEAALLPQQPPYLSHQLCNTWLLWASTGADGHSLSLTGHLTTTFLFLWSPPAAVLACSSSPLWLSVLPAQGAGVEHTEQCPDQVMMAQLWCKAMQTICIILYPPPEQPVSWTSPQQEKTQTKSTALILQTPPCVASQDCSVLRLHLTKALHQWLWRKDINMQLYPKARTNEN